MKNSRSIVAALASFIGVGAVTLAALTVPTRALSASTPFPDMTQVKTLYETKCSACHNLPDPVEKGYSLAEWQSTVDRMLTKYNASESISPTEAVQIVSYLGTFAPKATTRSGNAHPADLWATDSLDVWTDVPTTTRVFNFAAANPLSTLTQTSSGTPGPAPHWLVIRTPGAANGALARVSAAALRPDRFALLIDPGDQGKNLDVRVRFRIESGKLSPAVGIAFGLTDSAHYYLLRCHQSLGNLALMQMAGQAHTTLQQTPLILPTVPAPNTVGLAQAAPPAPAPLAPGWHTLRLLVKDGQVRGWLDMQKRISTTLPDNLGGKVALWTQGSTTASFQDWTVDWYDAVKTM